MTRITDPMGVYPETGALLNTSLSVGLGTVPIWWLVPTSYDVAYIIDWLQLLE